MQSITEQFKAFVASKPRGEGYVFRRVGGGVCGCAMTQFITTLGLDSLTTEGCNLWVKLHSQFDGQLRSEPHSFGALADRLSRIDTKEGAAG